MAKLFSLLVLWAACAAAQTVEGTVLDAATGSGVSGVKVELLMEGWTRYEATTDGSGRFRFDKVKEGDYTDRYQSADHWLTAGWADCHAFHAAAGSPVNLETRLMPWSKISGRVVDPKGNGVANAPLELTGSGMTINGRTYMRTSWGGGGGGQLGQAPLAMPFRGQTDAHGKFEVQLMPGTYGLSVVPPPALKPPDPGEDGAPLVWTRTYYPGVDAAEAASKIVVFPGSDVSGVELKLLAVSAHAVRGVLLNPNGTPAPKVAITMADAPRSVQAVSEQDGTFEFPDVVEGEWRLSAQAQNGSAKLRAMEWIEVSKHDLENVKLRLVPPLTLRGRVVMQGPKDAPEPRPEPLILSLSGGPASREGDIGLGGAVLAEPDANGDFVAQDAYPGVYRLGPLFPQARSPYYLDAIRIGDADLTMQEVEISSDVAITVVYKADGGSVHGKAENCASGGVVLVPSDPARRRPGFSKSAACDSSGNYQVDAVRPGDYYALAFAGNGPVLTVDDVLLNQAVKVSVRAGEASSADLKTITKPVY
jgi:Carboxypeptidase regulatory-like domain